MSFWNSGPTSTGPPACLLFVLYSRILSRNSFCTGSSSFALLKATAESPTFLRSCTRTAARRRAGTRSSWRRTMAALPFGRAYRALQGRERRGRPGRDNGASPLTAEAEPGKAPGRVGAGEPLLTGARPCLGAGRRLALRTRSGLVTALFSRRFSHD